MGETSFKFACLKTLALAGCCAAIAGCGGGAADAPQQQMIPAVLPQAVTLSTHDQEAGLRNDLSSHGPPRDAAPAVHELFRIDVYQFTAPIGTLGRNEDFWKRIDEECVDVGTYDLLFKNGIRVGVAPMSEFDDIRKHIDADTRCHSMSVTGTIAKEVELATRKDVVMENIFQFNSANEPVGRTYENCTNLMNLSFEPTPRRPGAVRVKLCPMVRCSRAELEYSLLNEEREFQWVSPESLYDLNLRVDIPPDGFLVVAPSSDADRLTSVGHAFLTQDGKTERLEQVIVMVPRPLDADNPLGPPLVGPPLATHGPNAATSR
jgi:hypothetical protein